ncbi:type II/IV secretion system protein, partial [Candidatus Poribacteria bacterium]|nr:type II/IV secretion system protein [Candidatus Poribacteria bacterium]
ELGFSEGNLALFEAAIHKPYGLILVSGPTGSGKSTTLFAALNAINSPDKKILTVENPVEYNLPGIIQVQTREDIQPPVTFGALLRSFLRQNPDVIMVGEMRDPETAGIGVQAALTGHLVFSTIHTNDAPSAVTRLTKFGVDSFLMADALLLVIAQRLPHTICKNCKVPVVPTEEQIRLFESYDVDTSNLQLSRGQGCSVCQEKGIKGRRAIHEVMAMNDAIREMVLKGASGYEIKQAAMENGMKTLRQDGLEKVAQGITTLEEILKITLEV